MAYTSHTTVHLSGGESRKVCVDVSGLSASWSMERDKQVLTDISFKVDQVTTIEWMCIIQGCLITYVIIMRYTYAYTVSLYIERAFKRDGRLFETGVYPVV